MRRFVVATLSFVLTLGPAATYAVEEETAPIGAFGPAGRLATTEVSNPEATAPTAWPSRVLKGAWAITAGHDRFVVVGWREGRKPVAKAWTSSDGLTWMRAPTTPDLRGARMFHVVSIEDGFVAMGNDRKGRVAAWHSPDGIAWERARVKRPGSRPFTAAVRSVVAGPSGLLAYAEFVGQDLAGDRMWRSSDGRTWRPTSLRRLEPLTTGALIATPDAYLLFDDGIWRSAGGLGWERVSDEPVDGAFLGVASNDDGTVVAVGVRHVDPYPLAVWVTRDLETWEMTWQSLDPKSAAACKHEAGLTIEASWMTWDGSQFAAHVDANRDWCGEMAVPEQLPLLVSSDGSAWVESTGPDGAPGYDADLWVNGVASLGSASVVLGGLYGGPAVAWLAEPKPAATGVPS